MGKVKAGPGHSIKRKGKPKEITFKDLEFECGKWSGPGGAEAFEAIPSTEN